MKKKAQVNQLTGFALTLVVFTIVLALGFSITQKLKSTQCTYSYDSASGNCLNSTGGTGADTGRTNAFNATSDMITYMAQIPGWIPVVIVAMIGGIVLFLVLRQFGKG